MPIQLNHTIVAARDRRASSRFLSEMLGLAEPVRVGPFDVVQVGETSLDFMETTDEIHPLHFAFLVSEAEFDAIFERIRAADLPFWADPSRRTPGEINVWDGGRGVYWPDPSGHLLEIITRPYGTGGSTTQNPHPLFAEESSDVSMASTVRYFRAQAHNNAWANHRLLTACEALSAQELAAERTSFFPSIIHTLNHILTVDWFYVSGLEDACIGRKAFEPEIPCWDITLLAREQRAVDRRLIAACEHASEPWLQQIVDLDRGSWIQSEPKDRILLHLFEHQIHHRGQVHAMLSGTAVDPPQLDEFFLGHERERALRARDFEVLGFDEDTIWR